MAAVASQIMIYDVLFLGFLLTRPHQKLIQLVANNFRYGLVPCSDFKYYPPCSSSQGSVILSSIYVNLIISSFSSQGSIIPVVVDITANHQGHFTFKLCPNNDIWEDPDQECFDRRVSTMMFILR